MNFCVKFICVKLIDQAKKSTLIIVDGMYNPAKKSLLTFCFINYY